MHKRVWPMIFCGSGDSQALSLAVHSTDLSWPKLNISKMKEKSLLMIISMNLRTSWHTWHCTCIGKDSVTKQAWKYADAKLIIIRVMYLGLCLGILIELLVYSCLFPPQFNCQSLLVPVHVYLSSLSVCRHVGWCPWGWGRPWPFLPYKDRL